MTNLKKEIEINEVRCSKCNSIIDLSVRDERIKEQALSTQKQEFEKIINEWAKQWGNQNRPSIEELKSKLEMK